MHIVNLYYKGEFIRYDFLDEPIFKIKEKLHAFDNRLLNMYPPFIKFVTNDKVVLTNDKVAPFFYIDEIASFDITVINITEDPSAQSVVILNDSEALEQLRELGYNLSDADFQFYKKLLNAYKGDKRDRDSIERYSQAILSLKERNTKIYNEVYKNIYYNKIYEKSKDFNIKNYISDINYNSLFITIRGNNIIEGVEGRLIDLDKVFNIFELSTKIPYIALGRYSNDPVIKIHSSLKNSKWVTNEWILNEKKKSNIATYKKVKGILFKINDIETNIWIHINILYNGLIEAKIDLKEDIKYDINKLKEVILQNVQYCIDNLNILSGVFFHSKKIESLENSSIKINNLSVNCPTNFRINKSNLKTILNNKIISDHIFVLKETIGTDIVSLFYKNDYKESDTKGIIVNVRDNNYILDSSILTIFSAINDKQVHLILEKIILTSLVSNENIIDDNDEYEQRVREKSKIKDLKRKGIVTDSKNCQKDKQPNINGTPLTGSYLLEYNNVKYVCPNQDYPYPGFTNKNIVCCFKKDQRNRENYIANTNLDSLQIMLSPSNKTIKIDNNFITYPLKVMSDYIDGFNERNSFSRYYYLDSDNNLISIKNDKLIDELNTYDNIWLDPVPLSKLINDPPKHICYNGPDLRSKSDNDLNKPCKHHSDTKTFGYTINGYPCCFTTGRDHIVNKSYKKIDITKEHILKYDKLLHHQRIGELSPDLNDLFNKKLSLTNGKFYRMGVINTNYSIYNAILLAFENSIVLNDETISSSSRFKQYIEEKYTSQNIINNIQNLLKIKIFILERDENDSVKLRCNDWYNVNSTREIDYENNIILFYNNSIYEILINVHKSDITYIYPSNSALVEFLLQFEKSSCIIDDKFPNTYSYIPMLYIQQLISLLKDNIIGQIIDDYNLVQYAITKSGFLIPVKESEKVNMLKTINITNIQSSNILRTLDKYINYYNTISKKYKEFRGLKLLNVIVDDNNDITSATTSFGPIIPIKKTSFKDSYGIPKSIYKYYNVDINSTLDNKSTKFYKDLENIKLKLYNTKKDIAEKLTSDLKDDIINIIKNTSLDRFKKTQLIHDILLGISSQLHNDELDVILYQISNDILNDNVENLLLNKIVISEFYNPDELMKRDSENVLGNIADIKHFFS